MANGNVTGTSDQAKLAAVSGVNTGSGIALDGESDGLLAESTDGRGVEGRSETNFGVRAVSTKSVGLRATSVEGRGIEALAERDGVGLVAQSASGDGVFGISQSGIGVHGKGGKLAGQFEGDVQITGTLSVAGDVVLTGGDCAEHFDVMQDALCEPGTVMAIAFGGALDASTKAYDKKVAGVVSGAGSFRPAIILDKRRPNDNRPPVALAGKVYCKVDAQYAPIEIGDILTTSDTRGHAMKASDPARSFGAVVGKALGPLGEGRGIIPILVTLH
jgi:hypothetical protein